jgi:nucleoside-diphosphate kinase
MVGIQQTLVIVKPDGLKKSLTGNILTRLSEAKLRLIGARMVRVSLNLAEKHYAHLKGKPFYQEVLDYITGKQHGAEYARVLALVYEGEDAIDRVRGIAGSTNPEEAEPTTIRGQYGRITTKGAYENVIHCSSSEKDAEREIKMWFRPEEIIEDIYPAVEAEEKVKVKKWAQET